MKKTLFIILTFALIFGFSSCKDDEPSLGAPPTSADAAFTYAADPSSDNIINFTASNSSLTAKWDFGNALLGEGTTAQSAYPNAGTYTVTLTVFNSGGSASSSQDIVIAQDDPSLLDDPLFNLLTGGAANGGEKIWVMDSTRDGHLGVGPVEGTWPEWWEATRLDKSDVGMYDDQYVFTLNGFQFDQITNGSAYAKSGHETNFSSSELNKGDFTVAHGDQIDETWTIVEGADDTTLTVTGTSFLGMYTGERTYKIVRLTENELTLRYEDTQDPTTAWYIRLVPEDFPIDNGGGGSTDPKFSLPIDFETIKPSFTTFGNSTDTIIDNPFPGGINTSSSVLETVHGNETWAGLFVDLDAPLDFSGADSMISVLVYAPTAGTMRVKIENSANTNEFVERDVMVPSANMWVKVQVGFSTANAGVFDRLVLFPGWDVANAGTFYLDDIKQE